MKSPVSTIKGQTLNLSSNNSITNIQKEVKKVEKDDDVEEKEEVEDKVQHYNAIEALAIAAATLTAHTTYYLTFPLDLLTFNCLNIQKKIYQKTLSDSSCELVALVPKKQYQQLPPFTNFTKTFLSNYNLRLGAKSTSG